MDQIFILPLPFFLSALCLIGFGWVAWTNRYSGWGLPMGVVLATIAFWYHGDALYNDYEENLLLIGEAALTAGWWQVLLFVLAFGILTPWVHRICNKRYVHRPSHLMIYVETRRLEHPAMQRRIDRLTSLLMIGWLLLMGVALVRVEYDFAGLFAPYLGELAAPWSRGRIGGGLDAFVSLGGYLQVLLTASFGVIAALARNPVTRSLALAVCVLSFPYYLFGRTRNTMLATMLPGMLAWVFLRLRGGWMMKGALLLGCVLLVNFWMSFVIANRGSGVARAFGSADSLEKASDTRHLGLNIFSELGYINLYFQQGTLAPNWGSRYFAEIVNPIPRGLWKNKPTVGLDYAFARGFAWDQADGDGGGVAASISTGMIGQGVVNFGRFLGPMTAALLMSFWVAILARQDFLGSDPARMLLYAVGMILTFNMGRDITLLILYPFVFGWLFIFLRNHYLLGKAPNAPARNARKKRRRPVRSSATR